MIAEWFSLAKQLRENCVKILASTRVETAGSLEESPQFFAVLLFCRTITNFKAAICLLEQRLIIEAQTLQRSCFENSLWIRRLAREGVAFAKEISDDGLFNEASFVKLIEPNTLPDDETTIIEKRIAAGKGKKKIILKEGAVADGAETDYAMFRQLSMSAAHPSSTSLLRHVVKRPDAGEHEISVEVEATDREVMASLYFSIVAMMNCLKSFIECGPFQEGEALLHQMAKRIMSLENEYDTAAFVRDD